jgi:hypothetical protein
MTTPLVTGEARQPFRAGHAGTAGAAAHSLALPEFEDEVVLLGDISEFQPNLADATYLRWSQAIVIRALYGTRIDKAWYGGARRAALHAGGARFVGIYAYITASQDVTAQAKALASLLGTMRAGEKIIADIEEGTGGQQARWVTWANVIHGELGDSPWDYSGAAFAAAHGLAPVDWVASYGSAEPDGPHKLWQFTDAYSVPGVGTCDCSVFHGSIDQLAALAWQGKAAPAPAPARPVLVQGNTGAAVRLMQQRLNVWSAAPHLAADGVFGPKAGAALRAFQASPKQHLTADGVCGPATWAALMRTP